ncbi:hypothetical protein HNR33_004152 [Brassicibacter mesophilus]
MKHNEKSRLTICYKSATGVKHDGERSIEGEKDTVIFESN